MSETLFNAKAAYLELLLSEIPTSTRELLDFFTLHGNAISDTTRSFRHQEGSAPIPTGDSLVAELGRELDLATEAEKRAERDSNDFLDTWRKKYRLTDDWAFHYIHFIFHDVIGSPLNPPDDWLTPAWLKVQFREMYPTTYDPQVTPAIAFKFRGWTPIEEDWSVYSKTIEAEFKRYLTSYRRQAVQRLNDLKLVPKTEQRALLTHLRYLVHYQVGGENASGLGYKDIERKSSIEGWQQINPVGADAIQKGVERAAARIGLTLRPARGGSSPNT